MPEWLKILLYILVILSIIAIIIVGAYIGYKQLNKPGNCSFVAYSPTTLTYGDSQYVQCGYISCGGGGGLWKPNNIIISNQGPGTFYIGTDPTKLAELDSGQQLTISIGQISPNVYFQSDSQYTSPNLLIAS